VLSAYGATAVRLFPREGEPEDFVRAGGRLAQTFEHFGSKILTDVLRDPQVTGMLLADGALEIEARRWAGHALLRVRWGAQVLREDAFVLDPEMPVVVSAPAAAPVASLAPVASPATAVAAAPAVAPAQVRAEASIALGSEAFRERFGVPFAAVVAAGGGAGVAAALDASVFVAVTDAAGARAQLHHSRVEALILPGELSFPTLARKLRRVREVAGEAGRPVFVGISLVMPLPEAVVALFTLGIDFIALPDASGLEALFREAERPERSG
jgi:hypothetical protein